MINQYTIRSVLPGKISRAVMLLAEVCAVALAASVLVGCLYDAKWAAFKRAPRVAEPKSTEVLCEDGDIALYAGETAEDAAFNAEEKKNCSEGPWLIRNSLFLRRRVKGGADEWRLVMTSGGSWKDAKGMDEWCADRARETRKDFRVLRASVSKDGRFIWMVCDPHTCTYALVCRFDLEQNALLVLGDGDSAEEQPDGTILIRGKKTYLYNDKGESLGAAWYDEWITPDGKVVREGEP